MNKILILIFSILFIQAHGQGCETFDRQLFHMLPKDFPDTVNCFDNNGQRHGWWLIYKIQYNHIDKPGELEKRKYIERFSYGRYENSRKMGTWKYVENVHQVYERRIDSFYYSKDSIVIISGYADGGWNETKTYYNADSTVIRHSHLLPKNTYPIIINCNKKLSTEQQCMVTYRESELNVFPFDRFEIEKKRLTFDYFRERKIIDNKKNKKGSK